jgi:hypothetical protein
LPNLEPTESNFITYKTIKTKKMKKLLCLIIVLVTTIAYGQEKDKYGSLDEIKITLRDGSIIEGLGRINIDEEIIFKENKEAEKKIYNYKNVDILIIRINDKLTTLEYKIIEGMGSTDSVKLLEKIVDGKFNLYEDYISGISYSPTFSGNYGFSNYSKTTYYICKNGDDTVIDLRIGNTYSERFKEIAQKSFSDCPDLLNKIDTKYFKRYGIREVVNYYNKSCK